MKNHQSKLGFTIIKASLFLALSGLLAVGLIVSANSSITCQRYNDSMNDFADFLRNVNRRNYRILKGANNPPVLASLASTMMTANASVPGTNLSS